MREKGMRCLRVCGFLLLLGAVAAALSLLFAPKNNRQDFGMGEMKANGILTEPENTIDVIAVGNSECATAIAPMVLWRERGITAYNCGTAGQHLYDTLHYLRQALENQRPSVVILETDAVFQECQLSDSLFAKLEELIPLLRYHDRWKSLRPEDLGPVEYTWRDEAKGHLFYLKAEAACPEDYMKPCPDIRLAPRWNRQCLKEIIALCEKNGAELLLVSTPSAINWNYVNHNGIEALAQEFGLAYVDLNLLTGEVPVNWATDTKDGGDHMNAWGAEKVSSYLARYLSEQYGLADHRGESGYEGWDEDLKRYEEGWTQEGQQ